VGGLRIWWLLRTRLGRPVEWYRSTAGWLDREAGRGRALSPAERGALERFIGQLDASEVSAAPEVQQAREVAQALLRHGKKVEQERF
jgi:hypothetical protein